MFQFLKQTDFDFMKRGRLLLGASMVVCVAFVGVLLVGGINLGVEFAGGSELQLKFRDTPDVSGIRSTLQGAGIGASSVTTIGKAELNEVYIRISSSGDGDTSGGVTEQAVKALRADSVQPGREDLNIVDRDTLERVLVGVEGLSLDQAAQIAGQITD